MSIQPQTVHQSSTTNSFSLSSSSSPLLRPIFDHEKLDVYQLELRFIRWVTPLLEEVKHRSGIRTGEVCDQLDRASLWVLLNTAEGNGKRQRPIRAKFFDDARGSATECAACLDALVAKDVFKVERVMDGKEMLYRIVSMLTKLIQLYSTTQSLHEGDAEYRIDNRSGISESEHEDENDDEDKEETRMHSDP